MSLASQEKLEERETWHKLVVKVIIWKEGMIGRNLAETMKKLTHSEWNTYRQRIIKINATKGRDKVLSDLKFTLQKIKLNGGLEE